MEERPRVAVGIVMFNTKGEVLLLHSYKWGNKYIIPGGHLEHGETLEGAVKREAKEETGLDVADIEFIKNLEIIDSGEYYKRDTHFIGIHFKCRAINESVKINDEGDSFKWVKIEEALKLELSKPTREILEHIAGLGSPRLNLISTKQV